MNPLDRNRIHTIDIVRGLIVLSSVTLVYLPEKYPGINVHAEWYGFTVLDVIFPTFITIFGTSMAIAYHRGIKKKRLFIRTFKLIVFGLLFNMIVNWNLDIETIRVTGVLQFFAVLGLLAVLLTKIIKKPHHLLLASIVIFIIHGYFLINNADCPGTHLAQPECNTSTHIDPYVFGKNHMYAQGSLGYDPEGIPSMFAALGNVLLGFAAGRIILRKRNVVRNLYTYAFTVFILCMGATYFLPIGKRIWTPAYGFLTAGITILLLAVCYMFFEKPYTFKKPTQYILGLFIAFGRNSFLFYFGKYLLNSLLNNIKIADWYLTDYIMELLRFARPYENLLYTLLMIVLFITVALWCHKKEWYLKV